MVGGGGGCWWCVYHPRERRPAAVFVRFDHRGGRTGARKRDRERERTRIIGGTKTEEIREIRGWTSFPGNRCARLLVAFVLDGRPFVEPESVCSSTEKERDGARDTQTALRACFFSLVRSFVVLATNSNSLALNIERGPAAAAAATVGHAGYDCYTGTVHADKRSATEATIRRPRRSIVRTGLCSPFNRRASRTRGRVTTVVAGEISEAVEAGTRRVTRRREPI